MIMTFQAGHLCSWENEDAVVKEGFLWRWSGWMRGEEGRRQSPAGTVYLSLTSAVTPRPAGRQGRKCWLTRPQEIIGSQDTPSCCNLSLTGVLALPGRQAPHPSRVCINAQRPFHPCSWGPSRPPASTPPRATKSGHEKVTMKTDLIVGETVWLCRYSHLFVKPKGALCLSQTILNAFFHSLQNPEPSIKKRKKPRSTLFLTGFPFSLIR